MPAVGVVIAWLVKFGPWLLNGAWLLFMGYQGYMMATGQNALVDWLIGTLGWTLSWAEMPEVPESWGELTCALNGWLPINEGWVVFKLYITTATTVIPLRWGLKVFGKLAARTA